MTLTRAGVEMHLGRKRIDVGWDDVRHVQLVTVESARKPKNRHTEIRIAPNRDDALPRSWTTPLFLTRVHDVYRLCTVDSMFCYLDISIATLDRELRRQAGTERWRPRAEEKLTSNKS